MCSTPKGRSRSIKHAGIQSLSEEMSADEYTELVQRANYSYEYRQLEIQRLRAEGKLPVSKLRKIPVKSDPSLLQYLLHFDLTVFFKRLSISNKVDLVHQSK